MTTSTRPEIDDVDRALIAGLVENGRATYAALAPQVAVGSSVKRP